MLNWVFSWRIPLGVLWQNFFADENSSICFRGVSLVALFFSTQERSSFLAKKCASFWCASWSKVIIWHDMLYCLVVFSLWKSPLWAQRMVCYFLFLQTLRTLIQPTWWMNLGKLSNIYPLSCVSFTAKCFASESENIQDGQHAAGTSTFSHDFKYFAKSAQRLASLVTVDPWITKLIHCIQSILTSIITSSILR